MSEQKCIFCEIKKGNIDSVKIDESENFLAVLDAFPGAKGHTLIFPKEHLFVSPQLNPQASAELGLLAKNVSKKLLSLGAQGTSFFIANGALAGQKSPHMLAHVIPRFPGDNVSLNPDFIEQKNLEETVKAYKEMIGIQEDFSSPEVILEDDDIAVLSPKRAFVEKQLVIVPKQKVVIFEELPNNLIEKVFQIANKLIGLMFEKLKIESTNILIQNGVEAGQINDSFSLNIIPRYEDDGLELKWDPKQTHINDLKKIVEEMNAPEITTKPQKKIIKEEPKKEEFNEDNYLTRSLIKNP